MPIVRREMRRFRALDPKNRQYVIVEYQQFDQGRTIDNAPYSLPLLKDYSTTLGQPLNQVDDDTYTFVLGGAVLRRVK